MYNYRWVGGRHWHEPLIAIRELGYPTITCLKKIFDARRRGVKTTMIIAGGLLDGGHLVKSLCLGANGIAMARPFIIASESRFGPKSKPIAKLENPAQGIVNFVEAVETEAQMLSKEDLGALNETIARMFEIRYVYE